MISHANSCGHTISISDIGSYISSIIPCSVISDHALTIIRGLSSSEYFSISSQVERF